LADMILPTDADPAYLGTSAVLGFGVIDSGDAPGFPRRGLGRDIRNVATALQNPGSVTGSGKGRDGPGPETGSGASAERGIVLALEPCRIIFRGDATTSPRRQAIDRIAARPKDLNL